MPWKLSYPSKATQTSEIGKDVSDRGSGLCNRLIYPSYNIEKLFINLYKPVQSEQNNAEVTYPINGFLLDS